LDKQGPTVVHQRPGPLQTIFGLPPDEVSNCCNFILEFMCYSNDSGPSFKELMFHCLFSFRLLTTVIHVPLRGHFCITVACMSLHGTFAFIQTSFLSRLRLAQFFFAVFILCLNILMLGSLGRTHFIFLGLLRFYPLKLQL
jgi:hypothetical protein